MRGRVLVVVLALILTAFAVAMVAGRGSFAGPQIVSLSVNHGVHVGDLAVLALWVTGMVCCLTLWLRDRWDEPR